jgi:hypothetical protein
MKENLKNVSFALKLGDCITGMMEFACNAQKICLGMSRKRKKSEFT